MIPEHRKACDEKNSRPSQSKSSPPQNPASYDLSAKRGEGKPRVEGRKEKKKKKKKKRRQDRAKQHSASSSSFFFSLGQKMSDD